MARKKRRNRGHFRKGHDPRRHVLTFEERSRGGQTTWRKAMDGEPHLLRWLQRKIDETAHPGTLEAYRRRKHG
jgi:hypothetical protein